MFRNANRAADREKHVAVEFAIMSTPHNAYQAAQQAQTAPVSEHAAAFAFVGELAQEVSTGKVELPSFPDVAVRVRKVLADEAVSNDQIARVVGSEAGLAARVFTLANSAALNRTGRRTWETQ